MTPHRIGAHAISVTLHISALLVMIASSAPPPIRSQRSSPQTMKVFAAPRDDDNGLPGLQALAAADDLALRHTLGSDVVELSAFRMNVAKIADRAAMLFPFVTPGLSLRRFDLATEQELRETFHDPFAPPPAAPAARQRSLAPLTLSDRALQLLIDRTWSRRDRWTPFQEILKLADRHNPDTGKLPALLHAYHRQNGLQPYVDRSARDPRLWAELGLAADHVEFIGFISRFASAHPSTKATTELLFLLDQLAQANMDALLTLVETDPQASLQSTRQANREAYELIVDLRRHYAAQLRRKELTTVDEIAAHYAKVRLGILTGILRTTPHGYRAADARFLIGAIYWREGERGDALRTWRAMKADASDGYTASIGPILDAIAAETRADRASADSRETMRRLEGQINLILRAEHGRWIMFSMDRLQKFGFHFDTF